MFLYTNCGQISHVSILAFLVFFQTRKWPLLTEVTMILHSNSIGKERERCQKEKIKFTNPNTTKCICTFLNFKIKNCLMFQNCASQISTRPLKA